MSETTAEAMINVIDLMDKYHKALERIAAFDDKAASEHLDRTGSFALFDEPGSVAMAREALKATPPIPLTHGERE